jgi:hypothetical protein
MYHRPLTIAGCVTGVLALLLLAWLVMYPVRTDAPMTARIAVLATADILLGMASLCLLSQAAARARAYQARIRAHVDRAYGDNVIPLPTPIDAETVAAVRRINRRLISS